MSESKEFQGKNLDEAIEAACKHFDQKREKLEIEILSGGSSGIFGLVGVKKAMVRAKPRGSFKSLAAEQEEQPAAEARSERQPDRPQREERPRQEDRPARREPEAAQGAPAPQGEARPNQDTHGEPSRRSERGRRGRGRGRGERQPGEGQPDRQPEREGNRPASEPSDRNGNRIPDVVERQPDRDGNRVTEPRSDRAQQPRRRERPRRETVEPRPPRREPQPADFGGEEEGGAPQGIGHLDQALLEQVAREVTQNLLLPLVDNAQITVTLLSDRVSVRIEDPENSGLLIGREGQTLASIQYLVNRLVSKRMDASVRVQIDAGDYRENQDERLRQIARHLADKAMSSGRTQSTRPMSSYHRRVVHLTLQDDEHVFTRSKGEGSMKRVLIMTKRKGRDGELIEDAAADQEYSESAVE
ncbi:MAG: Jag N-terminal domain-containing protein [Proteobacteria bacterium]|nr:Jag N-terminal domain-containing protein [Pseudomonadota bacterium]MBU1596795.1 Jag N-terminal domain-containing protein [Pseudomonadota bacterium]